MNAPMLNVLFMCLFIEVQLIYNAVLASGVQQSDSLLYIHTHTHVYSFSDSFFL